MKDKCVAHLFSIIQRSTFIVQWCDSWFHIPRSLGLHCDFSHSTPTHVGLGVPTVCFQFLNAAPSPKPLSECRKMSAAETLSAAKMSRIFADMHRP